MVRLAPHGLQVYPVSGRPSQFAHLVVSCHGARLKMSARRWTSSAATNRSIAGTSVPDADAMMIIARRTRTGPCFPRRPICSTPATNPPHNLFPSETYVPRCGTV